jgi:hypothetical protein
MLEKRRMPESVVEHGSRRARPLWGKLDCLNSNLDLVYVNTLRKERLKTKSHSVRA